MIKVSCKSISISILLIFEPSLETVKLPEFWQKANLVPVHKKKQNRSIVKSYYPITLNKDD